MSRRSSARFGARHVAVAVITSLVASVIGAPPANAAPDKKPPMLKTQREKPVPGHNVKSAPSAKLSTGRPFAPKPPMS
jgi:hypothetical protein